MQGAQKIPMEKWTAGGIRSPHDDSQLVGALRLLTRASTSVRESRAQLDRLYGRLSELLRFGRSFPQTELSPSHSAEELRAEISALGAEADAVLNNVATHLVDVADALSGASSVAHQSPGQATELPETEFRSSVRKPSRPRFPGATDTPDQITRLDDARYRE